MSDVTPPTWITVPLAARVVRARCRREEDVTVLRSVPVALPVMDAEGAPVCARLGPRDEQRNGEWHYLPSPLGLEWVRFDGSTYWRPLVGIQSRQHLTLAALDTALAELRREGHSDWSDWPFGMALRRYAHPKTPTLRFDEMALRYLHTDLDLVAQAEATSLAGRIGIIDGVVHTRCDEPVNEVRAIGLSGKRITEVVVAPRAGNDEKTRAFGRADVLQVFRADAGDEAEAYAREMAMTLGVPSRVRAFEGTAGMLRRQDAKDLPVEAYGRFFQRSETLIGGFPRSVVEAWLDLRDAGIDPDRQRDCLAVLFNLLLEGHRSTRMTMLAWFEAYRILPGVYGRESDEMSEEDAAAFAEVA